VQDAALLLEVIAGFDPRDSTSLDEPVPQYSEALVGDVTGLRIGLPHEYFGDGIDADVRAALDKTIAILKDRGAIVVDVTLPHTHLALPAYYIVAPAEASSNLARYDGIRYGKAASGARDLLDLYMKSRGAGFGREVKRRIMLGTYALRSGYYDAYYKKAQQIRTLIKRDFDNAFQHCDVILTPTTPTAAFRRGSKKDPLDMYLADVFTLSCNLAGLPGLSVPCGLTSEKLPVGAQLLGKPLDEATLLRVGHVIESLCGLRGQIPGGL
jgi:aspartyl-tRNA(Asn)/glutamyl-tRNA(Gln) amidotransferase subunit A